MMRSIQFRFTFHRIELYELLRRQLIEEAAAKPAEDKTEIKSAKLRQYFWKILRDSVMRHINIYKHKRWQKTKSSNKFAHHKL